MTIKFKPMSKAKAKQAHLETLTFCVTFDVIDQQVTEHEARDEWGVARKVVEDAKERFQHIPNRKWRKRYLEELEKRHCLYYWGEPIPAEVMDAVARENAARTDEDRLWDALLVWTHPDVRDPHA